MSGDKPPPREESRERLAKYREKLLELTLLGVPVALLQGLNQRLTTALLEQPWQAILFLIPIAAVALLFLRGIVTRRQLVVDPRFLAFLGAYILFFSIAAQTKFLDWQRDPALFGQPSRGGWLTPVSWGDWRYSFVPKVTGDDLVVVLREPTSGKTPEAARTELIDFIGMAASQDARAVALDYYFDRESVVDSALCAVMESVGIPILVGYAFERFQGRIQPLPVPSSLESCVTPENSAHLVGFLDADHTARLMPLFFNNDTHLPALSLMAARTIASEPELPVPRNGQVRFIEPVEPHVLVRLEELRTNPAARNSLNGRLVVLGEESTEDTFETPFGRKPGAAVHADATHSLLHSHYIHDAAWWVGLTFILASCYLLAAWCAAGVSAAKLIVASAVATACFALVAVGGILTGPYWFDVAYPTAAVWLLTPLLLGLRRALDARRSPSAT